MWHSKNIVCEDDQKPMINILILPFKRIWQFIIACLILGWILELLFWPGLFNSLKGFIIGTVWGLAIWISQWLGNSFIVHQLDKKISWIETPVKRAIIGIVSLISYSATAYIIVQTLIYLTIEGSLPDNFGLWALSSSKIAIIVSFSIAFVFTSVGFFKSWQGSNIEAEKLQAQMMTYKYESLRSQLNPHFLFNNFNVLSDLVYKDQKLAVKFISQMSDLYRYVLDNSDKEVVALSEELTFLKSYIFF